MQAKYLAAGAVLLLLAGGAYYLAQNPPTLLPASPTATSTSQGGTATSTTSTVEKPNELPPLPTHVLPEGATAVDNYFFTYNNSVYLKSVAGTSTIRIPNALAGSFKKLSEFRSVPDQQIARDCVQAGQYAYYGDAEHVFMYELWLNSKFRHSEVTTLVGVEPESFEVTSPSSFSSGQNTYTLGYEAATSTCSYVVERQP